MRLEYTREARADIFRIQDYGIKNFGKSHSEQYTDGLLDVAKLIAFNPMMNNERVHLGEPVRLHFYKSHTIFYRIDEAAAVVKIIRILSKHQNWTDHL